MLFTFLSLFETKIFVEEAFLKCDMLYFASSYMEY